MWDWFNEYTFQTSVIYKKCSVSKLIKNGQKNKYKTHGIIFYVHRNTPYT